uniref:CCAAT enhancer binding protein delta n=1 Tax=Pelusios castaneus TaxID=367368 RepID=A0A8C8RP12_9SAUR
MSAAALYSLDSPACYRHWALEPANFYEIKASGGALSPSCKAGGGGMSAEEQGGGSSSLAELSAAAPAMYEDESAIDFSSYIDSMAAVPNLELCNDELFADLFNSNHKAERGGDYGDYLPATCTGQPAPVPQACGGPRRCSAPVGSPSGTKGEKTAGKLCWVQFLLNVVARLGQAGSLTTKLAKTRERGGGEAKLLWFSLKLFL